MGTGEIQPEPHNGFIYEVGFCLEAGCISSKEKNGEHLLLLVAQLRTLSLAVQVAKATSWQPSESRSRGLEFC